MENKEQFFDDLIRNAMQNLEARQAETSSANDFEVFEGRLRHSEQESDEHFDDWIRQKMRRYDATQPAPDWARMEQAIEEAFSWKRYLVRFKLPELALAVLAIWTYFNVHPTDSFRGMNLDDVPKLELRQPKSSDWNKREGDKKQQKLAPNPSQAASMQKAAKSRFLSTDKGYPLLNIKNLNIENNLTLTQVADANNLTGTDERGSDTNVVHTTTVVLKKSISDGLETESQTEAMALLELRQAGLLEAKTDFRPLIQPITLEATTPKRCFRIGMFGGFNMDEAKTFYMTRMLAGRAIRVTEGYGSGITVGYRKKRTELETGVTYAYKSYRPVPISTVSGDFNSGYVTDIPKLVSFNMINVPVLAHYYLLDKNHWSIHATAGASVHLSLQTDYDVLTLAPNSTTLQSVRANYPSAEVELFSKGTMEGGSWKDNYYLTLNAGAGVEYHPKVHGRWSIFGQYLYQKHIGGQGIGTNQDKINTMSIHIGAKARL